MMSFWKKLAKWISGHAHVAIALAATVIGLLLFVYSGIGESREAGIAFLRDIEQRSLDLRFGLRGPRAADARIVIVDIDQKTIGQIGAFPLPRRNYSLLLQKLKEGAAAVVAFDETFPVPESSEALSMLQQLFQTLGAGADSKVRTQVEELRQQADVDAQFAEAISASGNVVLGHLLLMGDSGRATDPKLEDAYYNVIWAKTFPQVLATNSGKQSPSMAQSWVQAGGAVAEGIEVNLPEFAEAAASYGFFNIIPDPDGTLRRAEFVIRYKDADYFPSLALQTVRQYENIPDQQIAAYISPDGMERIQFGSHELRPQHDGTALINYVGPYASYPHYSMADVLNGKVPASTFRNKIVLVGAAAIGMGDTPITPFKQGGVTYMGMEVHANIIDNLLHSSEPHRTFLVRGFHEEMVDLAFIVVFGAGLGVWFGRCRPLTATITVVAVLVGFSAFLYLSFVHWGRWYSFVVPASTLVISYVSASSFRVIFEEREKRRIRKTFSQYLSPGVIALIEKDPEKYIRSGGEVQDLSVMFSDICGFTTISERLSPDDLVRLLNEYFDGMTQVLYRHEGTLDKYIGDAIMAFWGSPYPQKDHAYHACCCALEMMSRLAELNQQWIKRGNDPIEIGIGLNSGPANVGNMGSEQRLSWTAMGDNVNLASRLEGMTRLYRIPIVISDSTYHSVQGRFVTREIDKIRVKGKKHPVTIYELMGPTTEQSKFEPLLLAYNAALACYRTHDWLEAAGAFGPIMAKDPLDGPTQVLLQRCLEFMEDPPPEDWDGVYVMKSK